MKTIPEYTFPETGKGDKLLVHISELKDLKEQLPKDTTHTLTYYDITLILDGEGEFCIGNQCHVVKPRDVIFSMPGEKRRWDKKKIDNGYVLQFEESFMNDLLEDAGFVKKLSYFKPGRTATMLNLPDETYVRFTDLIIFITSELREYRADDRAALRELLREALTLLDRDYKTSDFQFHEYRSSKNNLYMNKFIRLVDSAYKENHPIQYYSDTIRLTSNYLNVVIRQVFGTSIKSYVYSKILHEAKKQLCLTDKSITEIAGSLGYAEPSYFILFFRRQVGITPLNFRVRFKKGYRKEQKKPKK